MATSQHARLAPSGAHRWMECPGSVRLSEGLPDESSDYATYGTFAHYVAADCLRKGMHAKLQVGKTYRNFDIAEKHVVDIRRLLAPDQQLVTEEMASQLQLYLDAVSWVQENENATVLVEHKVLLQGASEDTALAVWGTADSIVVPRSSAGATRFDILDLKFGAGAWVPVHDNKQQMIYAQAALDTLPVLLKNVKTVGLHIVQPRHFAKASRWRTVDLDRAELEQWKKTQLQPAIVLALDPEAPCVPGKWCRWCLAFTKCDAVKTHATETAANVFGDAPAELAPISMSSDPATMSGDEASRVMKAAPMVLQWINDRIAAVYNRAYDLVKSGATVPDYKLIRKLGNRQWADVKAAEEMLTAQGVSPWTEPRLISPAQAEKKLGVRRQRAVKGLTTRPDNGTALVPVTDKRPAISPADVFDDQTKTKE